ncbi:sensor histidine kinase [Brachybacterium alimentarium]|uniref:sensor histidine kinase n=1 Tax=Brachybacterium alimentarium TaxID=47845 RepID=UPI003FD01BE9
MTSTAQTPAAAPSVRSLRHWAIALGQTLVSTALGLLLFLISFGMLLEEFSDDPPSGLIAMYSVDAPVGLIATLVIGPLRFVPPGRWHSLVHLLVAGVSGLSIWGLPATAIALYRLGLRRRLVLDVAAVVLVSVVSLVSLLLDSRIRGDETDPLLLTSMGTMVVVTMVPLLIGHVMGTRRELLESLRERAASADRERETAQRERVAAEGEAAALVRERDAAQQANRELRTVLMTLRTTDGDAPLATAPTLADIVGRCREEGQEVELTWDGIAPEDLEEHDRSTVVTLARILTEVTTNAAKHAPGERLEVTLSHSDEHVSLTARNPVPSSPAASITSTGHGLLGVQERARLLGGDAEYGARGDVFEVTAWMPW